MKEEERETRRQTSGKTSVGAKEGKKQAGGQTSQGGSSQQSLHFFGSLPEKFPLKRRKERNGRAGGQTSSHLLTQQRFFFGNLP
jgi:hypothetical protein